MPFNLDCPCPEQTKEFDFSANFTVDANDTIIESSIPSLLNTPFDKDEIQRMLNADAYAFWKQQSRQVRCPKPCREVISGGFESVPPIVYQIKVGPLNPVPGVPPAIRFTDLWFFTERLKMTAKCINPE